MHGIIHTGIGLKDRSFGVYKTKNGLSLMLHRIIKNGGDAAAGRRPGSGKIAVCGDRPSKRHLQMGMYINSSRQHQLTGCITDFFRQLRSDIRLHGHDLSVFHGDITVIHIRGSHHCSIFDDQIILFHSKTSFTAFSLFRVLCLFVFCFQYYIMFLSALFKNQLARRDTVHDRTDI